MDHLPPSSETEEPPTSQPCGDSEISEEPPTNHPCGGSEIPSTSQPCGGSEVPEERQDGERHTREQQPETPEIPQQPETPEIPQQPETSGEDTAESGEVPSGKGKEVESENRQTGVEVTEAGGGKSEEPPTEPAAIDGASERASAEIDEGGEGGGESEVGEGEERQGEGEEVKKGGGEEGEKEGEGGGGEGESKGKESKTEEKEKEVEPIKLLLSIPFHHIKFKRGRGLSPREPVLIIIHQLPDSHWSKVSVFTCTYCSIFDFSQVKLPLFPISIFWLLYVWVYI